MIADLAYTSKSIYTSNQVKFKPIYLFGLRAITSYTKKPLSFLLISQLTKLTFK